MTAPNPPAAVPSAAAPPSSALALLPSDAVGGDSESFRIGDRALQAPPTVCLQFGTTDGNHDVLVTKRVRDGLFHMFDRQRSQIWFHNGPFDIACFLEWYPELSELIWLALREGRVFDTMYLARLGQIARGDIGGPLGLDTVAAYFGVRPPTKEIAAEHPDYPGQVFDVRTSFGLWYGADQIPDPWYSYADYDGEVMLPLAARMVERICTPSARQRHPLVRLEDLAFITRGYVAHALWRTYGLRVNPEAVADLAAVGRAALARLQEAAQINGFLKPKFATRKDEAAARAAGHVPRLMCPVKWEARPEVPAGAIVDAKLAAKVRAWDARAARHAACSGCKSQAIDPTTGALQWTKDTRALKAAVVAAYEGRPPLTEPKKDKKTGKKTGGGQVATARHVLQDSMNAELESWSEYNEWGALMAKDMKIFARGVVHTRLGMANTGRITSGDPNVLNFRRTSFYVGTCPTCEYETTIDPREYRAGMVVLCPHCDVEGPNTCP